MKKNNAKAPVKSQSVAKSTALGFGPGCDTLIKYFDLLNENDEPIFQILDMFPIPIEIFAPDGTTVFFNRALMELNNVTDRNMGIGKYNLLKDPVCMDQLGYREEIQKIFKGETAVLKGFPAPIQDLVARGLTREKPFEAATMDLYLYPVWKEDKLIFIVCVFVVRNLYIGRPDVAKAREYMDTHWKIETINKEKV